MKIVSPKLGHGSGNFISPDMCLDLSDSILKSDGEFLPHWYQDGKLMFITFRLQDSLPSSKLEYIKDLYYRILKGELIIIIGVNNIEQYLNKLNYWLYQGYGECLLQYESIQNIVEQSINFYDGKEYILYDYVIMPNHVHMIILPYNPFTSTYIKFMRYTTRRINKVLGRRGKIWQSEAFDRIIRSLVDFDETVKYIKANPENLK